MLQALNLGFAYPHSQNLFQSINFALQFDRVGLVGSNGIGKTTLLRLLHRDLLPSEGSLSFDERKIHLLGQDALDLSRPNPSLRLLNAYIQMEQGPGPGDDWDYLNDRWEEFFSLKAQLEKWDASHLLALKDIKEANPGTLQRLHLALAFADRDAFLLLDEPSNHLDQAGRELLLRAFQAHRGGCLISSHDRKLLGAMDQILELHAEGTRNYGGGYQLYRQQKDQEFAARKRDWEHAGRQLKSATRASQAALERQMRSSRRAEKTKDKQGLPKILLGARKRSGENTLARIKSQHEDKIKANREKLRDASQTYKKTRELQVDLKAESPTHSGFAVRARGLNFRYEDSPSWQWEEELSFDIPSGERWAVSGRNGTGKSTLLRLIGGTLSPGAGEVEVRAKAVATLDQGLSLLGRGLSLAQLWEGESHEEDESLKRTIAARLGIAGDGTTKNLDEMSGGQRMRAALIILSTLKKKPDLLILDEPTNHLDIETMESLTETILSLDCTLIVVSHDRQFLEDLKLDGELSLDES